MNQPALKASPNSLQGFSSAEHNQPTILTGRCFCAAHFVQYEMSVLEQEYLKVFLLDTRNRVLDIVEVYHGCVNSSQVRIAEIFKPAIQRMAPPAIICCHNHPSGAPRSM